MRIALIIVALALPQIAAAKSVQWCVVDHVGKVSKCYQQKKSCDRHVKGRFNWQCVALER